ncbi:hypothetical protein SK128_014196 [Halocaridina rubra]|uniref:F-BAR domain-containing protein n=1 Tax=Halocaridina rubra TaxID=373956 RepID=A0AAN8ZYG1_HALRR
MGSPGNFADEFWNTEICDFSGWTTVHQRIKDGNKIICNYIDLMKQVTSAMENFGRSLLKAAKNSSLPDTEHGKLRAALQTARLSVEAWGQDSLDAATTLNSQLSFLSQHLMQAKDSRKRAEEAVKSRQNHLQDAVRKAKQSNKSAQNKLKERLNCQNQRLCVESKIDAKSKDIEKAIQAERKSEDALAESEEQCRESVFKHNESLQDWQNTTRSSLKSMQDVEEARVKILRDSMWSVANVCSMLAVQFDQHQESIRMSLSSIDVGQELSSWVKTYRTLQSPPQPLTYKPQELASHVPTTFTHANSKRSTVTDAESSTNTSTSRSGTTTPEPLHDATVMYEFLPRNESLEDDDDHDSITNEF